MGVLSLCLCQQTCSQKKTPCTSWLLSLNPPWHMFICTSGCFPFELLISEGGMALLLFFPNTVNIGGHRSLFEGCPRNRAPTGQKHGTCLTARSRGEWVPNTGSGDLTSQVGVNQDEEPLLDVSGLKPQATKKKHVQVLRVQRMGPPSSAFLPFLGRVSLLK